MSLSTTGFFTAPCANSFARAACAPEATPSSTWGPPGIAWGADASAALGAGTAAASALVVTTQLPPDRMQLPIPVSPSATEMLFDMEAADQVIAVDDQSNFPAEALQKPHTLSGYQPNVEAIAALKPDLVVLSDPTIKDQLEKLGIKVWVGAAPADLKGLYDQINELGAATGHVAAAAGVVERMKAVIDLAVSTTPKGSMGTSVYHELDPTFYSVTTNTFIGKVYELFGLKNIADGAQPGNDYPQLNAEYIVKANPGLIVLADSKCCGATSASVSGRPGWDVIDAVKNSKVVAVDDDIASRWGPRIVDFVMAISKALSGK